MTHITCRLTAKNRDRHSATERTWAIGSNATVCQMTLDTCYYLFEQDSDNLLSLTAFNDLIDWRTENIGQVSENAEHSKAGDDPSEKVDSRHQKRLPESETNNKKVILSFYRIVFFILCHCLTCILGLCSSYLILQACNWLAPLAADVEIK